jgi:hypothetical protein
MKTISKIKTFKELLNSIEKLKNFKSMIDTTIYKGVSFRDVKEIYFNNAPGDLYLLNFEDKDGYIYIFRDSDVYCDEFDCKYETIGSSKNYQKIFNFIKSYSELNNE